MSISKTQTVAEIKAMNKALVKEVLEVYPEKTSKRRAKHLNVHEAGKSDCGVKSNIKSVPGVMTIRGCAYAGSKGGVWGPTKDMIHIRHGPVKGGGVGSEQGHDPYQPRPGRMRPVFLGGAAQLLHRHDGDRHLRDHA